MEQFNVLKRRTTDLLANAQQNVPAPNVSAVGRSLRGFGSRISRSASVATAAAASVTRDSVYSRISTAGKGPHGTWERVDDIPALRRFSHSLDIVAGCAYIFGGDTGSHEDPVDNAMHVVRLPLSGASVDYYRIPAISEFDVGQQQQQQQHAVSSEDGGSPRSWKGKGKGKESVATMVRSDLGDVPAPRSGHASAVIGSRIFVYGGHGVDADMKPLEEAGRVWVFDTRTRAWSYLDPAPAVKGGTIALYPARRSHHCATATDRPQDFANTAAAATSASQSSTSSPSSAATATGSRTRRSQSWRDWTAGGLSKTMGLVASEPVFVGQAAENAVDRESLGYGTLFIHGGCSGRAAGDGNDGNSLLADVWAFDIRSRMWSELPSAPGPPQRSAALCISKDLGLFRFGGCSNDATEPGARLDFLRLEVETLDATTTSLAGGGGSGGSGKKECSVRARAGWQTILQNPTSAYSSAFTTVSFSPEISAENINSSSNSNMRSMWPPSRSAAFFEAVTIGGREVLVLGFGERDRPRNIEGHDNDSGGSDDGKFLDDVWTFSPLPSLPSSSSSSASVSAAALWQTVHSAATGGTTRGSRGTWSRVATRPHDEEDNLEVQQRGDGRGRRQNQMPRARGRLACAPMTNLEDCGILIWGGLGDGEERLGDGWVLRL